MKRILPCSLIVFTAMLFSPAICAAESVSGSSGAFVVNTLGGDFSISDVRSEFCSGAYGTVRGRHATFLHGVAANVEFSVSVLESGLAVEKVAANGRTFNGANFTFDVGALPVGGRLVVVAYGTKDGAAMESEPFTVNLDVASNPSFAGFTGLSLDFAAKKGYVERGGTKFEIGQDAPETSNGPWWLPKGVTRFSPTVGFKAEYSVQNGTFTFSPAALSGAGKSKVRTRRANGQFGKSFGIDYDFSVGGTMAMRWSPEAAAWMVENAGLKGEVDGKTDYTWPFAVPTPVGPVPMFAEVGLEASLESELLYHFGLEADGVSRPSCWEWTFDSQNFPTVSGALGVGANHLLDVKGGIKANGILEGNVGGPSGSAVSYGVNGTLFGTVEALGWSGTLSTDTPTYWFLGGEAARSGAVPAKRSFLATVSGWGPIPRDYLAEAGAGSPLRVLKSAALPAVFPTGGYPSPAPAVAMAGGEVLVAYLRDGGTRSAANRTEVVFGEGAESVWDDGTADFSPSLGAALNGGAVLAWMNAGRVFSDADDFQAQCKAMEIAVAVRDVETGVWMRRNLTDDAALDAMPRVAVASDGSAVVAWMRNDAGSLFGSSAEPTGLMSARWDGTEWSEPEAVANGIGLVAGFDVAWNGTNAVVVFVFDGDGNIETAGDSAVSAATFADGRWGEPVVMAVGLADASVPVAGFSANGMPMAIWSEGGGLRERMTDGASPVANVDVRWEGMIPGNARAAHGENGRLAIVWTENDGQGPLSSHPVVMPFDASLGAWGGPVAISGADGLLARSPAGAPGGGSVAMAWESVAARTNENGMAEYGATTLRTASLPADADPAILAADMGFATNAVKAGELAPVVVTVRNLGLATATNVAVHVYVGEADAQIDEDGNIARWEIFGESGEATMLDLPGGSAITVTNWWTAEDSFVNLRFTAKLELPDGFGERDGTNNEASWEPDIPSLSIENARSDAENATQRLLTVTVKNAGLVSVSEGTRVSFRRGNPDGEELGYDVIGTVLAGEGNGYDAGIAWDMTGLNFTSAWETVWAVIEYSGMDDGRSAIAPIRVMTSLDTDGDGLLDAEEERFGTNPAKADTDGDGVSDYDEVYVFFTDPVSLSFADAVDAPAMVWTTGGTLPWRVAFSDDVPTGDFAVSGMIGHNESTWAETTVAGAGTISFRWRSSCARPDMAVFSVDGSIKSRLYGEKEWMSVEIEIDGATVHLLRWSFQRGTTADYGSNAVWLDEVKWTPSGNPVAADNIGAALEQDSSIWTTDGEYAWSAVAAPSHDGVDAARSGSVAGGNYGESNLRATFDGPGVLSFWWRLETGSCIAGVDLFVDDADINTWLMDNADWEFVSVELGAGPHMVEWSFWSEGLDSAAGAWLDEVSFSGVAATETSTTPDPVPYSWLSADAATILAAHGGDYEAAANATAANGVNKVWECYVAGINPEDETARFESMIEIDADGNPVVKWSPEPTAEDAAKRTYKILGKRTLDPAEDWTDVTDVPDLDAAGYRFFKAAVEMK